MSQNPPETVIEVALHALFGMGDEREFKRQFAVQFLASWTAVHYTDYCARGMQETLGTPPVEDAEYLAQKAWEQWCAILLPKTTILPPAANEMTMKKEIETSLPVGSDALVLPLRLIDLDSPWLFGIGRDMTDEERENAERHGRDDNPPMSVLGVTHEGIAAVDGKELAQLFVASPKLLAVVQKLAAWDKRWPKWSDTNGTSEKELNAICEEAHAILAEASGQNAGSDAPGATETKLK